MVTTIIEAYRKYRDDLVIYLMMINTFFLLSFSLNINKYLNKPITYLLFLYFIISIGLIIEIVMFRSKRLKNHHWWQLKIDASSFRIYDWWREHPDSNVFTWNQRQTIWYEPDFKYFDHEILSYIKEGDKIVLWIHGKPVGIYDLGEVVEKPRRNTISVEERKYYVDSKYLDLEVVQVRIKYIYTLFDNPVSHGYCRKNGLSKYRHRLLGLSFMNPEFREEDPLPLPPNLGFPHSLIDYRFGKLDTYGWIPLKPIWEEGWIKILKTIKSKEWH